MLNAILLLSIVILIVWLLYACAHVPELPTLEETDDETECGVDPTERRHERQPLGLRCTHGNYPETCAPCGHPGYGSSSPKLSESPK